MLPMKDRFHLPDGLIYLDGNSLGPLPRGVEEAVAETVRKEWGTSLIRGWNAEGWMAQPSEVGDTVGALIGAMPGTVVMGDTLSIKVYQALAAALNLRPDRLEVLSDTGNFPTDLYMAEGLLRTTNKGHQLRKVAPEDVVTSITQDTAAVMLTHVDYRTGRMHDMAAITKAAHDAGALMIWDLAHSAGAVEVDLAGCGADFAVGCTYKYLNGGPGAPAFIYVHPKHAEHIDPALSGWLGHDAPFAFELGYRPAGGIERMRVGTPPVLQMRALAEALKIWDDVSMSAVRAASVDLCETFIREVETRTDLVLASPRDPAQRGSQVSFHFEHGYPAMQALIAQGVIGDFRAPDIMRFGFTPLFVDQDDVLRAAEILADILDKRTWDRPEYHARSKVT